MRSSSLQGVPGKALQKRAPEQITLSHRAEQQETLLDNVSIGTIIPGWVPGDVLSYKVPNFFGKLPSMSTVG